MDESPSTVLFDAACPLCASLAGLAAKRAGPSLVFLSWQAFKDSDAARGVPADWLARPADKLRVLAGGALLEGEGAWTYLLGRHRDLEGLQWLAARLGLAGSTTARALERAGGLVRRLCRRCGERL